MKPETAEFFTGLARDVVQACRVEAGAPADLWVNNTGGPLFKPCGLSAYPAFWPRDFAMSLESGLFTDEEIRHALFLTAATQAPREWRTSSGSRVGRGAIADHILFDGTPIFFPGTCNPAEQGGPWGDRPPMDNAFHFIHMAWHYFKTTGRTDLLADPVAGVPLLDRLEAAFHAVPAEARTGLVTCGAQDRGVNYGFMDGVYQTGALLFASLLRAQAARALEELTAWAGETAKSFGYQCMAEEIGEHLGETFGSESGALLAATGVGGQPDVWGTAYAVHHGLLDEVRESAACRFLEIACVEEGAAWKGQIRHVPPRQDFSEAGPWERLVTPLPEGAYQNGAYWATPSGWVCDAIGRVNEPAAHALAEALAAHFMEEDFRLDPPAGAPWECVHPRDHYRKEGLYMTSVTAPLIAFRRLGWLEQGAEA